MKSTIRYRRNGGVLLREIAGETLLIPVKGALADLQKLYVLEGTGAFIWEKLEHWKTRDDIEKDLATVFDVDAVKAKKDVDEFVAGLREAGLLEESA